MGYRPPDWPERYPPKIADECSGIEVENEKYLIFEEGADAMLEALRKTGQHATNQECRTVYDRDKDTDEVIGYHFDWFTVPGGLTLVYIPDDQG